MSFVKISDLPAATQANATDQLETNQSGTSRRLTVAQVATYVAGNLGNTTVNGTAVVSANSSTNALRITQTGTGNALVVEDSANPDATPFVVDANGVVGIGETAPSSFASAGMVLRSGTASTPAIFNWNTTNDTSTSSFGFRKDRAGAVVQSGDLLGLLRWQGFDSGSYRTAAQVTGEVDGTPGASDMPGRLVFSTTADGASSPTERMRINNAGNVGIGVSSPGARLDVWHNDSFMGRFYQTDSTKQTDVYINNAASANNFLISRRSNGESWLYNSGTDALVFHTNAAERMRINGSSGNVGIGTSAPADALTVTRASDMGVRVQSTAGASFLNFLNTTAAYVNNASNTPMLFQTNNTERMRITNAGNVGIGTSSPGYRLDVRDASNTTVHVMANTSGVRVGASADTPVAGAGFVGTYSNHPLTLGTNNAERARITSGGDFQFNSGYGSVATAFGCRAWVNFNGTGTVAIRASGNVSSITDGGIGTYTVNFVNAMPDVNYCAVFGGENIAGVGNSILNGSGTRATGSLGLLLTDFANNSRDDDTVQVAIFR